MIKLITSPDEFAAYGGFDLYYIRIMSLLNAYGTAYSFAAFYAQIDEKGRVTAIISRLDNDFTVSHIDHCDNEEIADFFSLVGFSSILCDDKLILPYNFDSGTVMKSKYKTDFSARGASIDEYPKLMDLFNFEDYSSMDFEAWYVDISHRVRHGCARAYTLNVNGEIASSAVFSAVYNDCAVLSAVRTAPEYRHMGYGSALVSHMTGDVGGDVYLMRAADKNESFYTRLGFVNYGIWRMYK